MWRRLPAKLLYLLLVSLLLVRLVRHGGPASPLLQSTTNTKARFRYLQIIFMTAQQFFVVNACLTGPQYVLYWNEAYGSREFGFCCGREPLERYQCPQQDCVFTTNRSLLPDITDWDAVWFASRSLPSWAGSGELPDSRAPRQRYILWEIESPANLFSFSPQKYGGYFNWTVGQIWFNCRLWIQSWTIGLSKYLLSVQNKASN